MATGGTAKLLQDNGIAVEAINKKHQGGVHAESLGESAGKLNAPRMIWNARSDEVVAEGGNVEMKFPQGTSRAHRCRFTLDFSTLTMEGNVVSESEM